MPDVYTGASALLIDQTAYDLAVYHALRPLLYFDQVADVQATRQSFNGAAVKFTIVNDLAAAITPLSETVDVDAVALSDSQVTLTLLEYGNAVLSTKLLRSTGFVPFDPIAANVIGYNAAQSVDTLAANVLAAGTNVRFQGAATSRATTVVASIMTAAAVRRALADLRGGSVMDFGGYYGAFIHPDVSYDLRAETGAAAWRDPHTYSQPDEIWMGEIGAFEGFRFVETPTAPLFANTGSPGTVDVYRTMFLGRQALAKAYSHSDGNGPYPMVVPGPVTDKLRRNVPLGWYWIGAYGIFRQAALRAVESASSIGTN